MKSIIRSLSILSMLGAAACGGTPPEGSADEPLAAAGQEMQCATCEGGGGEEPGDTAVPIVHGYEIDLPLLRLDKLPPGWCLWGWPDEGGHLASCDSARRATMDWGGGNAVYYVTNDSWYDPSEFYFGRIETQLDQVDAFIPIAHALGYYQHQEPGLVRGSVELLVSNQWPLPSPPQSEIILALQVAEGTGWRDVATKRVSITNIRQMHELEQLVQPYQQVRFEVRAKARPDSQSYYWLWKVRMFGAQCYVDFANPGACL